MSRVHYNPSTSKAIYYSIAGKVQVEIPCYNCLAENTPFRITVTFVGVSSPMINGTYIFTQQQITWPARPCEWICSDLYNSDHGYIRMWVDKNADGTLNIFVGPIAGPDIYVSNPMPISGCLNTNAVNNTKSYGGTAKVQEI